MQLYMNSVLDIHLIVLPEYCYINMIKYKYSELHGIAGIKDSVLNKLNELRSRLKKS